MALAEGT